MSHHIVILVLIGALFTNVSILGTNASKSYRKTLEFKKVAARPNFKVETAGSKVKVAAPIAAAATQNRAVTLHATGSLPQRP